MEHDEMIQWMVDNPSESEAMIEEYRAKLKDKDNIDYRDITGACIDLFDGLDADANFLELKKDAPSYDWGAGSLHFQADDDANFIAKYFANPDQVAALTIAMDAVDEAEDVLKRYAEQRQKETK